MDKQNITVLRKILYAVESGDQIYGEQDYAAFAGVGANCSNEKAITIGAGQWYADEAKELLYRIQRGNPKLFKDMDTENLEADLLKKSWTTYAVSKDSTMMECVNIRHQGGDSALKRIVAKTAKPYTADKIYTALRLDLEDPVPNQVGDYTDRQKAVIDMIHEYAISKEKEETVTMTKTEKAIQQMEAWARADSHGYDQDYRWGEKGDYDCSSAIISAWENAGVPVKSKGATYTGDMRTVFLSCGFKDITNKVNVATGAGLIRGDVLLNTVHHTAMYCGNGKEVEASINEKGTAHGGKPGDQTGKEFLIRNYRNYPWDCILRYQESSSRSTTTTTEKVAYVARMSKDAQTFVDAGKTKSTLWPKIKKNTLVDVIKGATIKDSAGKKFYLVRLGHPAEGFVREYVLAGSFKKIK